MVEGTNVPKYDVDVGYAHGVVIGDQATQNFYYTTSEQWLVEESMDDVRASAFVPPTHGQKLVQIVQSQHLLLLCGANRMGKAALARYVAACLQDMDASLQVFRLRQRGELPDIVDALSQHPNQVILGYDVHPAEVVERLESIQEMAMVHASFVILTADLELAQRHLPVRYVSTLVEVVPDFPYTDEDLQRLLSIKLEEQLPYLQQMGIAPGALLRTFSSPSQIIRFSDMLSAQPEPPDKGALRELFQSVKDVRFAVSSWLQKLDKNERYLVLTLALFDDLPEQNFWEIYESLVGMWQDRDFTLMPLDYYALSFLTAFVEAGQRLGFKEAEYRNIVLDQLLHQYRRSLVMTLPFLQAVPEKSLERGNQFGTGLRIAAAQAVGQISLVEWAEAEGVLLAWARHPSTRVRAATSHAFRQMADVVGEEGLGQILDSLNRWVDSHTPPSREEDSPDMFYVRWTVASSLGRISRSVSKECFEAEILPLLHRLSHDEHFQVRASVVYALRTLGVYRFDSIRRLLVERAADWHADVRLEVALALRELSATLWPDVHSLLCQWFGDEGDERLWTALAGVLLMAQAHPSLTAEVYAITNRDPSLKSRVQEVVKELLASPEGASGTDHDLLAHLVHLVREGRPAASDLLILPLTHAVDFRFPNAKRLIESWQASSDPVLSQVIQATRERLAKVLVERKRLWAIVLAKYLEDDVKLADFAATLPSHEQEAFWGDVQRRREAARAAQRRQILREKLKRRQREILIAIAIFFFSIFACCAWSTFQNLVS